MNLENLYSFLTVAREGSITKASKILHITQPALSIRLRKLEEEVGFKLLERNWEGVQLTGEGEYFASTAVQNLQDLNATASFFKECLSEGTGLELSRILSKERLTIGGEALLTPFVINHIMPEIRSCFPEFDCHYISRRWRSLGDLLDNGGVDVAIYIHHSDETPLRSFPLVNDRLALFYSPKHYGHIEDDLSNMAILKDEPFILCERYVMAIYETLKIAWYSMFGRVPERFHVADEMATLTGLLAGGQGYSILPSVCRIPLVEKSSQLRMIPLRVESLQIPIHLAFSESQLFEPVFHHLKSTLLDKEYQLV